MSEHEWHRALECALSQFEGYVRRGELGTLEGRRRALDDAMQHAFGLLSLRTTGERITMEMALTDIADIAAGSRTTNSLPHIEKIARAAIPAPVGESGQ